MGDAGPEILTLEQPFPSETRPFQRRLNIGIVGVGRVGRRHALNVLQRTPRATLLCVCSPAKPDLLWAEEHLKPYGVQVFTTFEQMIQCPALEGLIVASPAEYHLEQTEIALDRGIHVLCEKPVCASEGEVCFAPAVILLLSKVTEVDSLMIALAESIGRSRRSKTYVEAYGRLCSQI